MPGCVHFFRLLVECAGGFWDPQRRRGNLVCCQSLRQGLRLFLRLLVPDGAWHGTSDGAKALPDGAWDGAWDGHPSEHTHLWMGHEMGHLTLSSLNQNARQHALRSISAQGELTTPVNRNISSCEQWRWLGRVLLPTERSDAGVPLSLLLQLHLFLRKQGLSLLLPLPSGICLRSSKTYVPE